MPLLEELLSLFTSSGIVMLANNALAIQSCDLVVVIFGKEFVRLMQLPKMRRMIIESHRTSQATHRTHMLDSALGLGTSQVPLQAVERTNESCHVSRACIAAFSAPFYQPNGSVARTDDWPPWPRPDQHDQQHSWHPLLRRR